MIDSQILCKESYICDKTFKGPDRIISLDSVVSDVEHSLGSDLRSEENIIFIFQVIVNVVCVVRVNNLIDGVEGEVQAVVVACKERIDFGLVGAESRRVSCIIAGVHLYSKL